MTHLIVVRRREGRQTRLYPIFNVDAEEGSKQVVPVIAWLLATSVTGPNLRHPISSNVYVCLTR